MQAGPGGLAAANGNRGGRSGRGAATTYKVVMQRLNCKPWGAGEGQISLAAS